MRAIFSYGAAAVIVLLVAAWLATGRRVTGGNGPGQGEKPISPLCQEDENRPLHTAVNETALATEGEHPENGEESNPHLTTAERVAQDSGGTVAPSVRTQTFVMQPMALEAPLRGRTKAKSVVSVLPETAGRVTEVHVTKGQRVATGDLLCTIDRG